MYMSEFMNEVRSELKSKLMQKRKLKTGKQFGIFQPFHNQKQGRFAELMQKPILKRRLSAKRMYFICQQLSFALESGISLPMALQLAAGELNHRTSRMFLLELQTAMEQGRTISQALAQTEIAYAPVFLEFVLAGEQNGTMTEALQQAAVYFEQQDKTKQMLFSALCYPAILLVLMIAAFSAMLLFVVPAVVSTYQNVQAELPALTQFLLLVGEWLKQYGGMLLCAVALLVLLLMVSARKLLQHTTIRNTVKRMVLMVPLLGTLYQQYWFIQISQGLGLMLGSGMLLVNGLQAVSHIYRRSLFSDELSQLTRMIATGHGWSQGLQQCRFVPKLALQMLIISEQSGTLPKALIQLNRYYQQQFQQKLHLLMSILEPCMIIVMGIGVLAIGGSLFLPLVQSYQYLL